MNAVHRPAGTAASFASDVLQLLKGSDETLIAARAPAFVACATAATMPRRMAARLAYHGLLAPRAEWRSALVPKPASDDARAEGARSLGRWTWARLPHRVFAIEMPVCERCGGPRRILGAVTAPHAVRRVLVALGLAAEPPPGRPIPAA